MADADPGPRTPAGATSRQPTGSARVPQEVVAELGRVAGDLAGSRLARRLAEGARAYERDRYPDAKRILTPLARQAPDSAAVRELLGLTLYRMGKWRDAIRELETFAAMSGSLDQHPVLADCHRALGHRTEVARLWDELRRASPSPEVVAEGRIVAAGSLADGGDVAGALELLQRSAPRVRNPKLHHLRLAYALADLYERAGEVPRARALFATIAGHDAGFADVAERLAALR